jgi:hypothetical protein
LIIRDKHLRNGDIMKRRHQELIDELRAAKPQAAPRGETWAKSDRAERLLERVLAEAEAGGRSETRRLRVITPRLAWLAGALALVGIALFLALYLIPGLSGQDQTASQSTVTSSSAPVVEGVTKEKVLAEIVSLLRQVPGNIHGQAQPLPGEEPDVVRSAQALGLIRGSEVPPGSLGQSATRREFAVWVWRGWGQVLPPRGTVPAVADRGTLNAEEGRAVDALVSLGVMQLDGTGAFRGDDHLTSEQAAAALARVRVLLEK